jgi:predicted nuclease with TOPRIM domain
MVDEPSPRAVDEALLSRTDHIMAMLQEEREERRAMHRENQEEREALRRESREQHTALSARVEQMQVALMKETSALSIQVASHIALGSHPGTEQRLEELEDRVDKLEDTGIANKAKWGVVLALLAAAWAALVSMKDHILDFIVRWIITGHGGKP